MYRYNKAENKIVEVASIGQPASMYFDNAGTIDNPEKNIKYLLHIAALKSYPCHPSCIDIWEDGKEVEQDKDFQFEQWCNNKSTLNGVDTFIIKIYNPDTFNKRCDYCYLLATPTPPVVNENEVWEDIAVAISEHDDVRGAIEYMQKNYTITKK